MTTIQETPNATDSANLDVPLAVALLAQDIQRDALDVAAKFQMRLAVHSDARAFEEWVRRHAADMVLIDSDMLGYPSEICEDARSQNPDAKVMIIASFWSEREDISRDCADQIVHKPVRAPEWEQALNACGLRQKAPNPPTTG